MGHGKPDNSKNYEGGALVSVAQLGLALSHALKVCWFDSQVSSWILGGGFSLII